LAKPLKDMIMNIYRIMVVTDQGQAHVIVVASNDEAAFRIAQIEVEKHYIKLPVIKDLVMYERKKIGNGGGYVIDEAMD